MKPYLNSLLYTCLLYTSDAADERSSVDLGGRRIIKKKTSVNLGGRRSIKKKKKKASQKQRGCKSKSIQYSNKPQSRDKCKIK